MGLVHPFPRKPIHTPIERTTQLYDDTTMTHCLLGLLHFAIEKERQRGWGQDKVTTLPLGLLTPPLCNHIHNLVECNTLLDNDTAMTHCLQELVTLYCRKGELERRGQAKVTTPPLGFCTLFPLEKRHLRGLFTHSLGITYILLNALHCCVMTHL